MMRLALLALVCFPLHAAAGAQQYEPLADSVRVRLSTMVSDRAAATMHFRSSGDAQRWLDEMEQRLARRGARLHAGDAVLDQAHRAAEAQSFPPAHQPRLRLRDPAPLPRRRGGRLLPGARPLQRQPRPDRLSAAGARRLEDPLEIHRAYGMIGSLLERHPRFANWMYGFTPPEHGTVLLVHRRVYIVPTRLGWLFAGTLVILLIGSINYALALGFGLT